MSEFIEPTGEDIDVATTPSTIFNEPVGEDIFDKNVKPEAKTDGGISLEAVPDSNFFDLLKSIAPSASSTMDFVTNPALSILSAEENSFGNYAEGINTILQNMTLENQRIENVLLEKYGDSYSGVNQVGDLSFNERDSLARRSKFEDKFAYFKRKYPEGRLVRTGVGGDKTEILYSLTKDGPLSRVDPNGGFSDFTGDFGDFTGTFANFATAGSIIGSFISPFLGTASLTIAGSMLDRALADEGVDVEDESFRQKTYRFIWY